ncbi:14847_t:CDS:10 [Cetraspora pellucida]|uniref:14847_t:CDS:1 n=1 Tax=Cetraspora pellucida TaxID=1433469 RepID=A0A9N9ATI8_9GLOM|nr:14847_t:CDS:10 [Cetraspora pellucida]
MSFESVGQNKSISENVTKETSTSPLQDIITPIVTSIVQQPPSTTSTSTNIIFQTSSLLTSSFRIQNSQIPNSRIPTFKTFQHKTTSSIVTKSPIINDHYEKKSQDILEYNTIEFFENEQTNNLNDLGGDVSNLNHLNNGGPFNLSESSGVLSSSSNTAGQNGHLRRWHSSNSGLHHSKSTTFGNSNSENDEIRAIYERWKLVLPKDDSIFDQYSSCVDRYGFITSSDGKSPAPPLSHHELRIEKKESIRSLKWALWVSSNKFVKKSGKFGCSSYVFPWDKKMLLTLPSQHEKQIDLDIPRTLHSHIMFRSRYGPGQRALFNILRAFSNYNKQIGYCQGMTNIVTILLMYYTEESAFIMLTKLFTKCNLHNLFIPGFPALLESFYVQEKLLLKYAPKIASQFNKIQLSTTAYATRWYITLFTSDVVPHHTVLRIWDLLMLHGFDILYFVAVALLKYHKATLTTSSFEHTMIMLSTTLVITDDDRLIKKVKKMFDLKGRKALIDTLKAEYRSQFETSFSYVEPEFNSVLIRFGHMKNKSDSQNLLITDNDKCDR